MYVYIQECALRRFPLVKILQPKMSLYMSMFFQCDFMNQLKQKMSTYVTCTMCRSFWLQRTLEHTPLIFSPYFTQLGSVELSLWELYFHPQVPAHSLNYFQKDSILTDGRYLSMASSLQDDDCFRLQPINYYTSHTSCKLYLNNLLN